MSGAKDGGPAFPCEQHETQNGAWNQTFDPGMSLRDWFAGQALAGVIAVCAADTLRDGETSPQMFARKSYAIADAMLAERGA